MKKLALAVILVLAIVLSPFYAQSQGSELYGKGIRIPVNEDGSKYVRLISWHQMWVRYNENNEGSLRNGEARESTLDVGIRRSRFLVYAQISPRFIILTHWGINNQNAVSGGVLPSDGKRPQLYVHDAWTEYRIWGNYLSLGAGLHYWNGVSRMASASTLNFLAIDAPIINWPTIETTDQFARMLGVYAKGFIGPLEYRVAMNNPFLTNTAGAISDAQTNYSPRNNNKAFQGYFSWNLWDKESNLLPFYVGSYLGSKKVLNFGAGFLHNADAMWSHNLANDTLYHDMRLFGADVFLDLPLNEALKTALTFYGAYYSYDYGPNHVRNIGILNPANGGGGLRGNAVPLLGTGTILYGQAGYLLPASLMNKARLQPYAAISHARLEGLRDRGGAIVPVQIIDIGANLLLEGHHAKATLNYRHRPDFTNIGQVKYRPEITLQTMIYL